MNRASPLVQWAVVVYNHTLRSLSGGCGGHRQDDSPAP